MEWMRRTLVVPRLLVPRGISERRIAIGLGLIAVEDTGAGLDPTKMDRICDAFTTTKPDG